MHALMPFLIPQQLSPFAHITTTPPRKNLAKKEREKEAGEGTKIRAIPTLSWVQQEAAPSPSTPFSHTVHFSFTLISPPNRNSSSPHLFSLCRCPGVNILAPRMSHRVATIVGS